MRKLFTLTAAAAALAVTSVAFAEPASQLAPLPPLPMVAPVVAPAPAASTWTEQTAKDSLYRLLHDRAYGEDALFGQMDAWAPGDVGYVRARRTGDLRLDALLGKPQPQAWFVNSNAGGFWVWEYGVAAPADRLGEILETANQRQNRILGTID